MIKQNFTMIEVFKTNVQEVCEAQQLTYLLLDNFPESKINFDLHDCDKILRVEGGDVLVSKVIAVIEENGFACTVLD